jgi:KipI family sensor histidine kinase inhibitor
VRILPMGERSVLVELDDPGDVHRLRAAALAAGVGREVVPGWRTLLLTTDGDPRDLAGEVERLDTVSPPPAAARHHEIPVRYDGEDLDDVAAASGLTSEEVVALHASAEYIVVLLGFSRGFPYLAGLSERLRLPRLATPRTKVPAGAVGIALDQCGIYPMAAPGGWRLLGRTDLLVFDETRDPPNLLGIGDTVRFVAVDS